VLPAAGVNPAGQEHPLKSWAWAGDELPQNAATAKINMSRERRKSTALICAPETRFNVSTRHYNSDYGPLIHKENCIKQRALQAQ
jgi:hypothetical protein